MIKCIVYRIIHRLRWHYHNCKRHSYGFEESLLDEQIYTAKVILVEVTEK